MASTGGGPYGSAAFSLKLTLVSLWAYRGIPPHSYNTRYAHQYAEAHPVHEMIATGPR